MYCYSGNGPQAEDLHTGGEKTNGIRFLWSLFADPFIPVGYILLGLEQPRDDRSFTMRTVCPEFLSTISPLQPR